jgi:predicted nucleic-acid-binding protein
VIGLDSNVLLRLFVDEEPDQSRRAAEFIAARCSNEDPGFVNCVTLCEVVWVLKKFYSFDRGAIAKSIRYLLSSADIRVENPQQTTSALTSYENGGVDFADVLVAEINLGHGCSATATFDRKAAKLAGFTPVK